ncbi:hypothetical protein AIOL_004163 [Candidatus Rhodobacter oscarellae]|uniref:Response regulatory domain-containing protein n=1 Tax=Candidatus Rhodobacter oscarellae TaxID=1675527 RepID=A0A0J9E8T0_9RHOB|nr:response regulator [Candidatus Rhodobacter lobularis]KMW59182.1 hypothetical protein AIOL_004163 [Candidatus Rhodobacter lobularis]
MAPETFRTPDLTVLLADDDTDALEELADIVDLEGWKCLTAPDVDKALELIAANPAIKVVVTDVHFVDQAGETSNGLQLVSRAQARFADRGLSFVVLSGDPSALQSSIQIGAVDFLSKPLVAEDLVRAIKQAEASGGEERGNAELASFMIEKAQKAAMAAIKQDPAPNGQKPEGAA